MRNEDELMNYAIKQEAICRKNDSISDKLFEEYGVNRGLRDMNGKGVLTGLTNISKIVSFKNVDGVQSPCDGELWYRGYNVHSLVRKIGDNGFGFEKIAYLLLFGEMPSEDELKEFCKIMAQSRTLPTNFTRDVIMKAPTKDIMNSMTRSILTLGSYDSQLNSPEIVTNSLRQCMELISIFPMLAVYGYHAYNHYENDDSMYIHRPEPGLSTAENLLMMLRPNKHYSRLEAKVLDVALILHMEHGGGNNSTFTTRVVTSSGSDTYSTIAAAMSSLKGPKHGGANIKVMEMMENIRANIKDVYDKEEVEAYLAKILAGEVFDHKGLIYGMGHAVYSLSDPRERVFKKYVEKLAVAKAAYERGDYEEAKSQIDSIKILYPKAFEARKAGQALMLDVETKAQQKTLAYLDSAFQAKTGEFNAIKDKFILEKDAEYQQVGNYLHPAQTVEKNMHRSFLRFQVDELGNMSMTSIYCGAGNIHHVGVKVVAPDGSFAETPASKDSYETTDMNEKIEKADYKLGADGNVIGFINLNKDKNLRVEYLGDRAYKTTMSPTDRQAAASVYELAQILSAMQQIKKEQEEANLKIEFINKKKERKAQEEVAD